MKSKNEVGIKLAKGSGEEMFLVSSGKVIVTDPCYDKDTWCNTILNNVAEGWWYANVTQAKIDRMGHRICEMEAELAERYPLSEKKDKIVHDEKMVRDIQNGDEWEEINADIGVDSGQAGFFDANHFRDEAIVSKELMKKIDQLGFVEPNEKWYGMSCVKTLSTAGWGVIPFGAVARSGFGDGVYTLYVKRFIDEIIAMKIVFIPVKVIEVESNTIPPSKDGGFYP